jgi:hypothetical protein
MEQVEIKVSELDGKRIAYSSETLFYVQTGRYKSSFKTRYTIKGSLGRAAFYFTCLNVGNGYKKRLLMNDETLAVKYSEV